MEKYKLWDYIEYMYLQYVPISVASFILRYNKSEIVWIIEKEDDLLSLKYVVKELNFPNYKCVKREIPFNMVLGEVERKAFFWNINISIFKKLNYKISEQSYYLVVYIEGDWRWVLKDVKLSLWKKYKNIKCVSVDKAWLLKLEEEYERENKEHFLEVHIAWYWFDIQPECIFDNIDDAKDFAENLNRLSPIMITNG